MAIDPREIHFLIVRAQIAAAREKLHAWFRRGVSRPQAAEFTRLAWRAGLSQLGLRILHPFVRPSARRPQKATPAETAEYAQCLIWQGALIEGDALLSTVDPEETPRVLFYQATACLARWDYPGSVPLLTRYTKAMAEDRYQCRVAEVNIAMALVYEGRAEEAEERLCALEVQTRAEGLELLYGRVLAFHAYNDVERRHWKEARERLAEAARTQNGVASLEAFLVRKLLAIVDFLEKGDASAVEGLRRVRAEAAQWRHWETIRDCDRISALARDDEDLLVRLYFGTPYAHYRSSLAKESHKGDAWFPSTYRWVPRGGDKGRVLDLRSGCVDSGGTALDPGSVPHRLVSALVSDLYRPCPLVALFSSTYPGRAFDPGTSPGVIHNATLRLRRLLKAARLPLVIEEHAGFYRLRAVEPCSILLSLSKPARRESIRLNRLSESYRETPFSLPEAMRSLALPKRTVQRLLSQGVDETVLLRQGSRGRTRYSFCKPARI